MAYATLQDLIDRYGSDEITLLTDRSGSGSPDAVVAGTVLSNAADQMDAYLAARYQLPLNPVPGIVLGWNCDIARFQLYRTEAPANVTLNYKTALAELAQAQKGLLTLECSAVTSPTTSGAAEFSGAGRIFSADSLRGY